LFGNNVFVKISGENLYRDQMKPYLHQMSSNYHLGLIIKPLERSSLLDLKGNTPEFGKFWEK
jgi:hypothetical protein